jgi:hypothetical protein
MVEGSTMAAIAGMNRTFKAAVAALMLAVGFAGRNKRGFLALAVLVSAVLAAVWMSLVSFERSSRDGSIQREGGLDWVDPWRDSNGNYVYSDLTEFARRYEVELKKAQERECMLLIVSRSPYAPTYCEKKSIPEAKFITTERKLSTEGVPLPRSRPY